MKSAWLVVLLLALVLTGCGGDSSPVNKGKDKPVPAKKENKN